MIDPRGVEPRDETTGEIRSSPGDEGDSVTQKESTVREESIATPELEFDPANSQIVKDLESCEVVGMMADDRMPDDMRLNEVSMFEEGLSLPVDVDRSVNDPASLEAIAKRLRELAGVEAELDQCQPETKVDPSLKRTEMLTGILNHPERVVPVIHVAGTNNKISTMYMIEPLVRALGRHIDRATSPHLQPATERITIDGQPIHPHDYVRVWYEIQPYAEMADAKSVERGGPQMSGFEVLAVMAYAALADAPVDVAAVGVGVGGTRDAANAVEANAAVICPISLDHMEHLGDTLTEIASEKVGIIKSWWNKDDLLTPPDSVVITGEQEPETIDVALCRAMEMNASIAHTGAKYGIASHQLVVGGRNLTLKSLVSEYGDIHLSLHGSHQACSATTALAAMEAFFGVGSGHPLNINTVRKGLVTVTLPGHLERVRSIPTVFIDVVHSPHDTRALRMALSAESDFRRVIGVLPVLGEKDARKLPVELKPYFEEVVIIQSTSPHVLYYDDLADLAEEISGEGRVYRVPTLPSVVELAVALVEEIDTGDGIVSGSSVIVTGSVATVGEAWTLFGKGPQ